MRLRERGSARVGARGRSAVSSWTGMRASRRPAPGREIVPGGPAASARRSPTATVLNATWATARRTGRTSRPARQTDCAVRGMIATVGRTDAADVHRLGRSRSSAFVAAGDLERRRAMRADALPNLEARLVEVEVVLDAAQRLVGDPAPVAQADDRLALALEDVGPQALVGERALFEVGPRVAALLVEPRLVAPQPELVELVQPPQRLLGHLAALLVELLEALERRPGGGDARDVLLAVGLVARPLREEPPQDHRQREALPHDGHEDDRVGQEHDQVA